MRRGGSPDPPAQRAEPALRSLYGDELLRVNRILSVEGEAGPLDIHGVHHVFHPPVELARWRDADRRSRLVVIVRDLDRAAIEESWRDVVGDKKSERLPTASF